MANPDPLSEHLVTPLLGALRRSLDVQLSVAERRVCRLPLVWSNTRPPAEFCDCTCPDGNGMGWVRLVSLGPSRMRDAARIAAAGCGAGQWAATVELGVWRCDSTMLDDSGNPPDESTVTDQFHALTLDAAALRRAVRCSTWLDQYGLTWTADRLEPVGPNGGCVGAAMQIVVEVDECGCPQPPEVTSEQQQ